VIPGIQVAVEEMIAEGDRVGAAVQCRGRLTNSIISSLQERTGAPFLVAGRKRALRAAATAASSNPSRDGRRG